MYLYKQSSLDETLREVGFRKVFYLMMPLLGIF